MNRPDPLRQKSQHYGKGKDPGRNLAENIGKNDSSVLIKDDPANNHDHLFHSSQNENVPGKHPKKTELKKNNITSWLLYKIQHKS